MRENGGVIIPQQSAGQHGVQLPAVGRKAQDDDPAVAVDLAADVRGGLAAGKELHFEIARLSQQLHGRADDAKPEADLFLPCGVHASRHSFRNEMELIPVDALHQIVGFGIVLLADAAAEAQEVLARVVFIIHHAFQETQAHGQSPMLGHHAQHEDEIDHTAQTTQMKRAVMIVRCGAAQHELLENVVEARDGGPGKEIDLAGPGAGTQFDNIPLPPVRLGNGPDLVGKIALDVRNTPPKPAVMSRSAAGRMMEVVLPLPVVPSTSTLCRASSNETDPPLSK